MTFLLAHLSVLYLATASASVLASSGFGALPQSDWVDVCDYKDPNGVICCSPGMEGQEYRVLSEPHNWEEHDQLCR